MIDIRALSDLVESIVRIHAAAGNRAAIVVTLRAVAGAIDDQRWRDRVHLLTLIWAEPDVWNDERIAKGLKQISIDSTRDPEILQVYLDVTKDDVSLTQYRRICHTIAEETLSEACRLQYRYLAALRLYLHGDNVEATRELRKTIEAFECVSPTSSRELYGHIQYGRALTCLASWSSEESDRTQLAQNAYNSFKRALDSGRFNRSGQASVLQEMGEALAAGGRWKDARELAHQSNEVENTFHSVLLLINANLRLGDYAAAKAILDSINFAELPADNQVDHSLALAEIACETQNSSLYGLARERLLAQEVETPFFRERVARLAERLLAQERESILKELEDLKRSHEQTSFDPLRLSTSEVRSVMRHHRFLEPSQQALSLPLGLELVDMLNALLEQLCRILLDQRAILTREMRSNEDTYTAFIALQLQAAVAHLGWQAQSQDYGGEPREGSADFGRRDITVRKDGSAPFAIVEAVRARTQTDTTARDLIEHVDRLVRRYDTARSAVLFVLVFVETSDLSKFRSWYCAIFPGVRFESVSVGHVEVHDDLQPLVSARAQHTVDAGRRTINHILVRL